ncbi:MAG: anaerobic ribonucleoside-triphosphate reductase activating protein [Clostridia bacterium]|nr:anaerobic ribonucleoside-triphosphate reductase activating protein [Clostridia bacterium]
MDIRLFGTANDSIVDGPGIRYAVFVQGCPHRCPGCHNPGSHNFEGGYIKSIEELASEIKNNPLLDGVTFSGGEPFCSAEELSYLASLLDMNVFCYTGYLFEELVRGANKENHWGELLSCIDVLVDGKFEAEKKSYELLFKGSSNQRIIDVPESLKTGSVVLYEF